MAEMMVPHANAGVSSVRLVRHGRNVAMTNQERAMVDLIRELVLFLSKDRLVDEVTARVGRVLSDPGVPMSIGLQPAMSCVHSAKLGRYPDSGLPYVLTLEPEPDARPTAGALKAVLGNYKRALTGRGMPIELIFPTAGKGPHWRVAVIVTVDKAASNLDSARMLSVAFRRDPTPK